MELAAAQEGVRWSTRERFLAALDGMRRAPFPHYRLIVAGMFVAWCRAHPDEVLDHGGMP